MQRRARSRPTLSVVVPTYREAANVAVLFERIKTALDGLPWEMIVVDDDSPDGTSEIAFAIAASDRRLRCLRRVNRTGLAGAVIEGWMSSSADFVAVIDGDLQHDERILPKMYGALEAGSFDLAIGTRVAERGAVSRPRGRSSAISANGSFNRIAGATVTDPMSGFFMIRRELVSELAPRLSPDGFKILVDVILSAGRSLKIVEMPYTIPQADGRRIEAHAPCRSRFSRPRRPSRDRRAPAQSASSCSPSSARSASSSISLALSAFRAWFGMYDFQSGQIAATLVAMGSNFVLNNEITYRTHRYRGPAMIGGFVAFALGCSVGALANINVASFLYRSNQSLVGRRLSRARC